MTIEDDTMQGSISSLILNSLESKQTGDVLSPEDMAWVDSCLIKDPEISDNDWNSLKDALLEIITSHPESVDSFPTGNDGFPSATDIEIDPSCDEEEKVQLPGRHGSDLVPIAEVAENNNDDLPLNESISTLHSNTPLGKAFLPNYSETLLGKAFLPNYSDGLKESENIDSGNNLVFSAYKAEPSTENIFRVWDLDIPAEEDELVKQLNKALTESSSQSVSSTFNDSGAWKDLKPESLDDLVASIADLSLNQNSG